MTVVPRVVSQSDDTSTPDIPEDQLCVYVLILSAPLPPSAVHARCSCCSYARNLHSPVHCSACLCHHSGSKGAKVHVVFLSCSSFTVLCVWFTAGLQQFTVCGLQQAWDKTPKNSFGHHHEKNVLCLMDCSFTNLPILDPERDIQKVCQKLKTF